MTQIQYPFETAPDFGKTLEVAPGILWLRMPLPMALDHINLYLIEDGEGWLVIDTGMAGDQSREVWEQVFANDLGGKPITRVLCTHMHPDHIGMAGWLAERWRAPLLMTAGEYFTARTFSAPLPDSSNWELDEYFCAIGFTPEEIEQRRQASMSFSSLVEPMPRVFHRLNDGQRITIGDQQWLVMTGEGHSPEHACLYNPVSEILISGDQVLPGISSNVSVTSTEPDSNPLKGWLASLEKFQVLPKETLVLPSHNKPFRGLHYRLHSLAFYHEKQFAVISEACQEAKSARDLLPVLFKRELDPTQSMLALGECVAHLNYMVYKQMLIKERNTQGVAMYHSQLESSEESLAFHE